MQDHAVFGQWHRAGATDTSGAGAVDPLKGVFLLLGGDCFGSMPFETEQHC